MSGDLDGGRSRSQQRFPNARFEKRAPWRSLKLRSGAGSMLCSRRILAMVLLATSMARVFERALANACIPKPPRSSTSPSATTEVEANLGHRRRWARPWLFPAADAVVHTSAAISLRCHSQQGFRCDDTGDFCQDVSDQAPYPLPRADVARRLRDEASSRRSRALPGLCSPRASRP